MASRKSVADIFHNEITAWAVLAVSLFITIAGWYISSHYVNKRADERFQFEVEDARQRILKRMLDYEQVLRGGIGLLKAKGGMVDRAEWRRYIASLEIQTYFPGIQGIGYTQMLAPEELEPHIAAVRAEGFADYTVKPAGVRDQYSAIIYLEPFDWRNQRAFGYDMFSEPMRRSAMERARDTGESSVSGKVTLVQETEEDVQAGFLVYLPFYRTGVPLTTPEQRREALRGFVYSPFRMNDLMRGILGSETPDVSFQIFDGDQTQDDTTRLYDSEMQHIVRQPEGRSVLRHIALPGRAWSARFHSTASFEAAMSSNQPELIAGGGLLVDVLLFTIIWSLAGERRRVQAKAEEMTADIRNVSQRLELAQESADIGTWDLNLLNNHLIWDRRMARLYGKEASEGGSLYELWRSRVHPDDLSRVEAERAQAIAQRQHFSSSFRILCPDGSERVIESHATIVRDAEDNPSRMVGINMDITERHRTEEHLMLAASVFEHAHEGILITDQDERILDVNPTFTTLTGYRRDEVIGKTPRVLQSGLHEKGFYEQMWKNLLEKGVWRGEMWNRRKDGDLYAQMLSISSIGNHTDGNCRYVAVFSDITVMKHQQERLMQLAHFDALTQLPNRVLLTDRLGHAMAKARRDGGLLAVCYLDLDGFKPVNDTYGHALGDRLLVTVAERINGHLRGSDTASRLGGDEFVLLYNDLNSVEEVDRVLSRLLHSMAATYHLDGREIMISASIGVAIYPLDDVDPDTLLRHADQAMYRAKERGRNRYQLFDSERDRQARAHREAINRIEEAMEANEFLLYYQPKVNLRSGKVFGAEALLRWNHPELGILPPAEFLALIEESHLGIPMGDWVIREALRQLRTWNEQGFETTVSVNICGKHFHQGSFTDRLRQLLGQYATVRPEQLELEVLESTALDDISMVSRVIEECRELGVSVAIDDFGTGYSSLTYLKSLPADVLKIDRTFVRDMLDDIEDLAIVEGIIGLGQAFRRDVIAEGIEGEEHGVMLLKLGCELGQGYGISPPMPAEDLPGWAAQYRYYPSWQETGTSHWLRDDFPLFSAELLHRRWFDDLTMSLNDENGAIPPPELSMQHCRFGIWSHGDGERRYGHLPVFQVITREHERIHQMAEQVVNLAAEGRVEEAREQLSELKDIRDTIILHLQELQAVKAKQV